jgi:sialate O-acetylesterase
MGSRLLWFVTALTAAIVPAHSDVSLAAPFSDHMVLQRNQSDPIWGKASAGEGVTVTFRDKSASATTGADGKWMVRMDPGAEGGPFTLTIQGKNKLTVSDVLVGEVWLGGGQSNMEAITSFFAGPNLDTAKTADYPNLRFMTFAGSQKWAACTPSTALGFSATGFYFGRDLQQALKIPVGIVISAVGGTDIERWMDPASIAADPLLATDAAAGDLFQSWIAPLAPFAIKGAVWYQGENNSTFSYPAHPNWTASYYRDRFQSLIKGWRKTWGQGDFPLHIVQLANYMALQSAPGENSAWAQVREAQRLGLTQPNTELAVAIDIGDANDVHPKNKWELGRRLLLIAMAKQYGAQDQVYSGPMYQSMKIQGATVRMVFRYAIGMAAKGGQKLSGFEVAGTDGKWSFADASIHGDTVVASASAVPAPLKVRYAWANNPLGNLVNGAGLPASPFQTEGPQLPTTVRFSGASSRSNKAARRRQLRMEANPLSDFGVEADGRHRVGLDLRSP